MNTQVQEKLRTPSGNIIENSVQKTRTIFSPKNLEEVDESDSQQTEAKISQPEKQGVSAQGIHAWLIHTSDPHSKQGVKHDQRGEAITKGRVLEDSFSEEESDKFATPPATPARITSKGRKNKTKGAKVQSQPSKLEKYLKMAQQSNEQQTAIKTPGVESNSQSITCELEDMMKRHKGGEAQVIEIAVVHSMFKKLEEKMEEKIQEMKNQYESRPGSETEKNLQEKLSDVELECDVVKKVVYMVNENIKEITERISKLELQNYRRMATLSGLYTDTEDTSVARRQIDSFIADNMGINVRIENCYEIGSATPPTKVIIFQSLRDKEKIQISKS